MNPSTFFRQSAKRRYQARWIADSRLRGLDIGEEEMGGMLKRSLMLRGADGQIGFAL